MKKRDRENLFGSAALGTLARRWREGTLGEVLEDWRWILGYTKRYRRAVACYAVLGVASASLGLVSAVAGKYAIDVITGRQVSRVGAMAALMVGAALVSLALRSLVSRASARINLCVNNDIQAAVFDSVLNADYLELNRFSSGDLLNRLNGDVGTVAANAVSYLPNLIVGLYTFCATFLVILHYDAVMALIALGSAPFLLLASRYLMKRMRRHNQEVREITSGLMTFEAETFYNLDTFKSFGLAERRGRDLRTKQEEYRDASLRYNLFTIQTDAALSLLGLAVQFTAFGYCLYLLWSGRIAFGTMTLFLSQSGKLSTTFNSLAGAVPTFLSSSVAAHRIRELTQLRREPRVCPDSRPEEEAPGGFEVCLRQVSFRYGGQTPVMAEADFLARPGEIVSLVGPSGEGKTTMIRLMLGLVRPEEGRAFLRTAGGGETELNAGTRHLFSYVPQGNTILSGTIAENLRLVKEGATDGEIEAALRLACAWEFVSGMPGGIHAAVGERGRGLSEGQAQRLAIARAVLRDAPILLLDEATSALDEATERRVLRNLAESRPRRTCIVTTHRPSVLNLCRRVYRVTDGRVEELTPEESGRPAMEL
ncbi:ABC transporter ATP-binding protein [Dysosmobacter sp.]|uniref:ABC transporter ATP-binding protein n=1 Tax=Dysosmobacter sp. TaxID=2591382 RepID=UPI002A8FF328|nr:ABC transporter ATP-binding protein [Dysosmobacter sp.]MDY3281432.1 ABC transporter ATP-binding protein [Dysosmobacter sp.]